MAGRIKIYLCVFTCAMFTFAVSASDKTIERAHELAKIKTDKQKELVDLALTKSAEYDTSKIEKIINSKEYQDRIAKHNSDARQFLGLEQKVDEALPMSVDETNDIGDRLVLFVSSSMPVDVLRNYADDLQKVGGVMIFRGTIGGIDSIAPTVHFLRKIMVKDPSCVESNCPVNMVNISVDPQRFSHHDIKKVPALIYEKNMKIQAYCKQGDSGPKAKVVAYGDASLAGLANAIYQQNNSSEIKGIVNVLRGVK